MAEKEDDKKGSNLSKILIDNHVALQKKSVQLIENGTALIQGNALLVKKLDTLTGKMETLTGKIDKLVGIFEEASKHVMDAGEDRRVIELADKLEELLEQNRNLTKGLLMLENYVRTKTQFER